MFCLAYCGVSRVCLAFPPLSDNEWHSNEKSPMTLEKMQFPMGLLHRRFEGGSRLTLLSFFPHQMKSLLLQVALRAFSFFLIFAFVSHVKTNFCSVTSLLESCLLS